MRIGGSTFGAVVIGSWILGIFLLVLFALPPPWPCDWEGLASDSRRLALRAAAARACADRPPGSEVPLELAAVWPGAWQRVVLLRPYHGNLEVLRRVGPSPAVMACTRSRTADEWTQVVLLGADGVAAYFDISTYLFRDAAPTLERAETEVLIRCDAVDAVGADSAQ